MSSSWVQLLSSNWAQVLNSKWAQITLKFELILSSNTIQKLPNLNSNWAQIKIVSSKTTQIHTKSPYKLARGFELSWFWAQVLSSIWTQFELICVLRDCITHWKIIEKSKVFFMMQRKSIRTILAVKIHPRDEASILNQ